jgi:hypothetical protein
MKWTSGRLVAAQAWVIRMRSYSRTLQRPGRPLSPESARPGRSNVLSCQAAHHPAKRAKLRQFVPLLLHSWNGGVCCLKRRPIGSRALLRPDVAAAGTRLCENSRRQLSQSIFDHVAAGSRGLKARNLTARAGDCFRAIAGPGNRTLLKSLSAVSATRFLLAQAQTQEFSHSLGTAALRQASTPALDWQRKARQTTHFTSQ